MMKIEKKKLFISIIILLALGFLYLYFGSNIKLNVYDEAIGIYGADRVAQGDIPYKDFWTLYAPGYFYLLAFLLNIIGWTISNDVKYLVLCENKEFVEPNESSISSGVFILDNYIHENYALFKQFGTNQIWMRKQ